MEIDIVRNNLSLPHTQLCRIATSQRGYAAVTIYNTRGTVVLPSVDKRFSAAAAILSVCGLDEGLYD